VTGQPLSLPVLWGTLRTEIIERKFVRDVGVLTLANIVGAALTFVQGILVARWLGPGLYGVAALVMSYPSLVYTFFDTRSTEASVKFLSEFRARNEQDRALAMCKLGYAVDFVIALLSFFVVIVTAHWAAQNIAHGSETTSLIIVYGAAFIPRALVGTSYGVLASLGQFPLIAWVETLTTFLRVALVLGFVLTGWGVAGIVWANAMSIIVTGLFYGITAWMVIYRTWGLPRDGSWKALKGRRREIFSFLAYNDINALLGMIPKQFGVVLLGYFRNPTEVGYYKMATSIGNMVGYLVGPLQSVTYPELGRLWGLGHRKALRQEARRLAIQFGLPLGLAVLVGGAFLPYALPLLVGNEYVPAVISAQLLLAGSAIWLALFWLRPLFLARGWIKEWTKCIGLFALCNLMGWLVIVPKHGYLGMSAWWLVSTATAYWIPPVIFLLRMARDEKKG